MCFRKSQINNLTLNLKQLEKEEMKNLRVSRRKEILKIRAIAFSKITRVAAISFLITFCMNYLMVQDSYIGRI